MTPFEDTYIDSVNSGANYGYSTSLLAEYYYYNSTVWRKIQTWLKFSFASIPPQATIQTATLSVYRYDYPSGYAMTLTASRCTNNTWSEGGLTWSNAPLASLPGDTGYTSSVVLRAGVLAPGWYSLNVLPDVQAAFSSGVLTEVLRVYPALSVDTYAAFYSKEYAAYGPTLTITYSYASAVVSVSPTSVTYGQSATIRADTDPRQTIGTIKIQQSTDNATWTDLVSVTGGAYNHTWTPPSGGLFYLRSVWTYAWAGGSYTATSNVTTLSVGKAASSLSLYLSDTSLYPGEPIILTAALSPAVSTGTLSLQYSTTGLTYTQITSGTPSAGSFVYTWTPPGPGTYYLRATWSGDASYNPSTSLVQTLTVLLNPTTMTLAAPTAAKIGETIALTATLRDQVRNPLAGASITFTLNAATLRVVTTGSSGTASLTYTLAVSAGTYVVKASYAGSAVYQATEESVTLIVSPLKLILTSAIPGVPLFNLNGLNYSTDASGKAVVPVNSTGNYTVSVNSPVPLGPGIRAVFAQWADGWTSPSRTVIMDVDYTLSALTRREFYLTIVSPYGSPEGSGWYDSNAVASFTVQPAVDHGNGTRHLFTHWSGDVAANQTSGSVVMDAPKTVTANWKRQLYVSVSSPYGTAGGTRWYDPGATAVINITPTVVETGNQTRYVFAEWTGDLQGMEPVLSTTVNAPKNVTASWTTEYFLEVKSAHGHPTGEGWYAEGSSANVSVEREVPAEDWTGAMGAKFIFDRWTGDLTSPRPSATILMDGPKTITAQWSADYLVPLAILGAVALVIILVVAYAVARRRPRPRKTPKETEPTA